MDHSTKREAVTGVWLRLLGYLRGNGIAFSIGVVGALAFAAANASVAWLMKPFMDRTFDAHDPTMALWVPAGLIVLFIVRGSGDFVQTYFMGHVGRAVIKTLRAQLFERLLHLPIGYFDRNASAVMLSRLIYNTEQVASVMTDSITTITREALTIIGLVSALFYCSWKLALVVFVVGPIIASLISVVNKLFRRYSRRIQDSVVDVTRVAKEALDAPRVIKVFNAQAFERAQFEKANEFNRQSAMKMLRTRGLANPVVQFIAVCAASVVLYIGIGQSVRGEITTGTFFSFIAALLGLMQPLRNLTNISSNLQQGLAAGQSLFDILDEPIESSGGIKQFTRARGEVEFTDVHFKYETADRAALDGVSLHVPAGNVVALVGRSGSGKSTLVNLLPRFYEIDRGKVLIDGHDIRDYLLTSLRDQIALVSQDVVLFDDSIRNNIAFGRPASDADIESVARAAHVLEFAEQLPHGLNTVVGERGARLSGGQKQRISIARALLKDAPILILDEATSALDTESERVIQAALDDLMRGRTTIVVAHRLSTIERAHRIVVMEGGRIVEQGSHAELLTANGVYANLHRLQFNV